MWKPWNNRKAELERARMAFRQYVMADLAGFPGLKLDAIERLESLKEMPRPAIHDAGFNGGFYDLVPAIPFRRIVVAWQEWKYNAKKVAA